MMDDIAFLDCVNIMGTSNVCVLSCVQADNVTTDSYLPVHLELNWVSTGSDMHVANNSKSSSPVGLYNFRLLISAYLSSITK